MQYIIFAMYKFISNLLKRALNCGCKTALIALMYVVINSTGFVFAISTGSNSTRLDGATDNTISYQLPSGETLHFETLWENDFLSDEFKPYFNEDADGDNHNIFVKDGKLCVFTIPYKKGPQLKLIDLDTGKYESTVTFDVTASSSAESSIFKDSNGYKYVTLDNAGNICMIALYTTDKYDNRNDYSFCLAIRAYTGLEDISNKENSKEIVFSLPENGYQDRYWCIPEIGSIKGDVYNGNFSIQINGALIRANSLFDTADLIYTPMSNILYFTNGKYSYTDYSKFESNNDLQISKFPEYKYGVNNKDKSCGHILANPVNEGIYITQGNKLTPPMLFVDNGKTDGVSHENKPIIQLEQVDALESLKPEYDESDATKVKEAHYGAIPVKVGEETLVLTTLRTYDENGSKFALHHWGGSKESFDGLTEICQFPKDVAVATLPTVYYFARPRFVIENEGVNGSDNVTKRADGQPESSPVRFYTYVPSMGIGAYRVSKLSNEVPSGLGKVAVKDTAEVNVKFEDGFIRIYGLEQCCSRKVEVYSIDGRTELMAQLGVGCNEIAVDGLSRGLHFVAIDGAVAKILVR